MENKRPYGRRKTDENRQTSPTRSAGQRRSYDKDEREKRPARKTFTNKAKPYDDKPKAYRDKPKTYTSKPKKQAAKPAKDDGLVRLNKFIANSGICSRREADTFIENGLVSVNGVRVTELGTKVDPA